MEEKNTMTTEDAKSCSQFVTKRGPEDDLDCVWCELQRRTGKTLGDVTLSELAEFTNGEYFFEWSMPPIIKPELYTSGFAAHPDSICSAHSPLLGHAHSVRSIPSNSQKISPSQERTSEQDSCLARSARPQSNVIQTVYQAKPHEQRTRQTKSAHVRSNCRESRVSRRRTRGAGYEVKRKTDRLVEMGSAARAVMAAWGDAALGSGCPVSDALLNVVKNSVAVVRRPAVVRTVALITDCTVALTLASVTWIFFAIIVFLLPPVFPT